MRVKSVMIVMKLLFLGALFIVSNHDLALKNVDDRTEFNIKFGIWVDRMVGQVIEVSGYVAKSEWLPEVESSFEAEWERIKD
jgi:hypothetical protein